MRYVKDNDPREAPNDDPREKTDPKTQRQTDKPWSGNPEEDQVSSDRPKPDLERWQDSETH